MSLKHITYGSNTSYPVAILIKSYLVDSAPKEIKKHYTDPLVALGIPIEDIIVIGLPYTDFKKVTAKTMNTTIPDLQKYMETNYPNSKSDLFSVFIDFVINTPF